MDEAGLSTHPYCTVHDQPLDWCHPPHDDVPSVPDALRPELTGTCQAASSKTGETCGEPSAILMTTGCRHEHLSTDEMCAGCAAYFAAGSMAGIMVCLRCDARRELISMIPLDVELAG
jgi:hypothetical protein